MDTSPTRLSNPSPVASPGFPDAIAQSRASPAPRGVTVLELTLIFVAEIGLFAFLVVFARFDLQPTRQLSMRASKQFHSSID